jgi:hypothetical protein
VIDGVDPDDQAQAWMKDVLSTVGGSLEVLDGSPPVDRVQAGALMSIAWSLLSLNQKINNNQKEQ